jgi:molybdenum cofactor guanylyltransferase
LTLDDGGNRPGEACSDAVGFVLAGGQSSRMGEDKAVVQLAGRPLVDRALGILRQAGLNPFIAGARSHLEDFAPVVADVELGLGPLGGICAALASIETRWAVFLPVDLPLLPASLITFLLDHAQVTGRTVTVSSVNGFAQTFPAVLERAALPALQRQLKAGNGGCFAGFKAAAESMGQAMSVVAVEMVVQSGHVAHPRGLPATDWFLNVNSATDLQRANMCV